MCAATTRAGRPFVLSWMWRMARGRGMTAAVRIVGCFLCEDALKSSGTSMSRNPEWCLKSTRQVQVLEAPRCLGC